MSKFVSINGMDFKEQNSSHDCKERRELELLLPYKSSLKGRKEMAYTTCNMMSFGGKTLVTY